jgi:hypothetical protein
MRKILSITIVLALSSCSNNKGKQPIQSTELSSYKTYTLEGCEYIVVGNGNSPWGTHKGNCKNPIHNRVR